MSKKLSIWKNLASKLSKHGVRKIKLPIEYINNFKLKKKVIIILIDYLVKKFLKNKVIIIKKNKGISSFKHKLNVKKRSTGRRRGLGKRL